MQPVNNWWLNWLTEITEAQGPGSQESSILLPAPKHQQTVKPEARNTEAILSKAEHMQLNEINGYYELFPINVMFWNTASLVNRLWSSPFNFSYNYRPASLYTNRPQFYSEIEIQMVSDNFFFQSQCHESLKWKANEGDPPTINMRQLEWVTK